MEKVAAEESKRKVVLADIHVDKEAWRMLALKKNVSDAIAVLLGCQGYDRSFDYVACCVGQRSIPHPSLDLENPKTSACAH